MATPQALLCTRDTCRAHNAWVLCCGIRHCRLEIGCAMQNPDERGIWPDLVGLAGSCGEAADFAQDWWTCVGVLLSVVDPRQLLLAAIGLPIQLPLGRAQCLADSCPPRLAVSSCNASLLARQMIPLKLLTDTATFKRQSGLSKKQVVHSGVGNRQTMYHG